MLISQRIKFDHVAPDIRAWFKSVIARTACPAAMSRTGIAPPTTFAPAPIG
jgi:hypothetical protein